MALIGLGKVTILEESLLEELRIEVEVRVGKLKNVKASGGDEVTGEIIRYGGDRVMDWIIWPLRVVLFLKTGDLL